MVTDFKTATIDLVTDAYMVLPNGRVVASSTPQEETE